MDGYLSGIFAVATVITLCSLLAYKKGGATKFAFSVLLVYTVLTPLSAIIPSFGEAGLGGLGADISEMDKSYVEAAERGFCQGVETLITSELGLSGNEVRVLCEGFDYRNMRAESVRVFLSGRAVTADSIRIRRLVEDNGLGECEVEIEIG